MILKENRVDGNKKVEVAPKGNGEICMVVVTFEVPTWDLFYFFSRKDEKHIFLLGKSVQS